MNNNYGKLIEGVLIFAPINLIIDDMQVINAEEADYISAGYLPIKYTPKPNENEWQAVYTEVDGVILQSWVYEGRIHDHSNLPLLEDVTINSLSGVPAVHILPEDAKDGDLCLYAPQNTLTLADSGKRIYFDWEEFRMPVDEGELAQLGVYYLFESENVEEQNTLEIRAECSQYENYIGIMAATHKTTECLNVSFREGILDTEFSLFEIVDNASGNVETTYFNSIDELPLCFDIPKFNSMNDYGFEGDAHFFHTEYHLMKYQGGEWTEVTLPGGEVTSSGGDDFVTREEWDVQNASNDERITFNTMLVESALKVCTKSDDTTVSLEPSKHYSFGEVESLTLDFVTDPFLEVYRNEYSFTFISGATPTVLTLPSSVQWANELTVEANKRYEISIVDNIGLWCAVDYTAEVSE